MNPVTACTEPLAIPTYGLGAPEKNPMFFEKRVYQGSCGKVYPVPFIDKVCQDEPPVPVDYRSVRMENDFVRLVLLPEIGGRIFIGQDKTNADYDFFYRQDVIKPALVGLAGPWISGGVEFNWPQHHRPGTYLPADVRLEEEPDGAATAWQSEHDPLDRLKGMYGIRLRPGSALIELRGRLYNRTAHTRTFLWWANVAARVHDCYQSFFPPDVHYVADHAVRATSSFPIARNLYYGVDYQARPGANDLRWYKNIPVPTSYMVCQTSRNFFGGYDFDAEGGFIHVASRYISPGKKQWTWGNHEFGWAWDRELTDHNGPYVELMAGVYTDNQPDFSYLAPYETKTFSQFWWPYRKLGPVQEANTLAAVRMVIEEDRTIDLGLAVSRPMEAVQVLLKHNDQVLGEWTVQVSPESPWQTRDVSFSGDQASSLCLWVFDAEGKAIIGYRPPAEDGVQIRQREVATEPPLPGDIKSIEELYLTGEHLEQYRHPTRYPEAYWEEALKREPGDSRCNIALGRRKLNRGRFADAAVHFRSAVARLTSRHPNPETGEAHYYLGLALRYLGDTEGAYAPLYKATWNYAWRGCAYYELACIDLLKGDHATARQHLDDSLAANPESNKTRVTKAIVLRMQGRETEAAALIEQHLKSDPLDHWALVEQAALKTGRATLHESSRNDAQTALDIAFDYARCGGYTRAIEVMEDHHARDVTPVPVPNPLERTLLTHYALAWLYGRTGDTARARQTLDAVRAMPADYCFPSRLEEMQMLEWALAEYGPDRNAAYGLGNFYHDKMRHADAIDTWESARKADPRFPTVHRNLGMAYWNHRRDADAARRSYREALALDPEDARLLTETIQLCGKLGDAPEERLALLEQHKSLALERDDACVELAALYNETGQPQRALDLLLSRTFHPWEGGEGKVLRQYTKARLHLGREALDRKDPAAALEQFNAALQTPDRLGEKYHPLQAKADVRYWQGMACRALGREDKARARFEEAALESGDFQGMAVTAYSELSIYTARALRELGRRADAEALLDSIEDFAKAEMKKPARIDYFATSLPNLLVFEEDIQESRDARMRQIQELCREVRDEN